MRTISAEKLISKFLKIKLNPKNNQRNGFIIKSDKFNLDKKFTLNINDIAQVLPHFQSIPYIDKLGEFMMGSDLKLGGSYLLRENNLIFYVIISIKTKNTCASFEIFSESNNQTNLKVCENIL